MPAKNSGAAITVATTVVPPAKRGASSVRNRIDFNDPKLSGSEAVEKNLAAQKSKD